jgi:hypothetical protein
LLLFSLWLLAVTPLATPAQAGEPAATQPAAKAFELLDGDRVVFLGGTFFEREAKWGYIETALTSRFPDRNVTFRNLGYAGDTVRCEARTVCEGWANFGPPQEGFDRLKTLIGEIKPTVVFVAYGMGESFEGEKALPQFVADYDKLLDMLTEASGGKPRFVLIGPNYHEDLGRPLPEPKEHNRLLKLYSQAVWKIAVDRGGRYIDLSGKIGSRLDRQVGVGDWAGHLTDDGIQLTQIGYIKTSEVIEDELGYARRSWDVDVNAVHGTGKAQGADLAILKSGGGGVKFRLTDRLLPFAAPAGIVDTKYFANGAPGLDGHIQITGLAAGHYVLEANDKKVFGTLTVDSEQLAKGIDPLPFGQYMPDTEQADQLRQLIVAKNADYFNNWRHENDTYILGYRKHEQGKNAVEFPEWVKLAEEKDKEIARLRVPQPVTYTLEREEKAGK